MLIASMFHLFVKANIYIYIYKGRYEVVIIKWSISKEIKLITFKQPKSHLIESFTSSHKHQVPHCECSKIDCFYVIRTTNSLSSHG